LYTLIFKFVEIRHENKRFSGIPQILSALNCSLFNSDFFSPVLFCVVT